MQLDIRQVMAGRQEQIAIGTLDATGYVQGPELDILWRHWAGAAEIYEWALMAFMHA
jgi:hypothetical protein